ncbi:MAG: serine hydrolase [Chitinophagaceae bacterium]|nr:serine hydrolase [Chitinophagaceae bacterium]
MARPFKTYYGFIISFVLLYAVSCKTTRKAETPDIPGPKPDTQVAVVPADTAAPLLKPARTDAFLEKLLRNHPAYFSDILAHKDAYKVQVIYTQIDRDENNQPSFKDYYFNVNEDNYFYPASTVKMPTALLALQKLNELNIPGLHCNTPMITESGYSGQTPVYNDPTTPDGCPTVEQYIKKIFLVSDNDAFNRLYEFAGQEYINHQLHQKGYGYAAINHRLEVFLSQDENRHTNPIGFRDTAGNMIYNQPMQFNRAPYSKRNDVAGKGYYQGGVLINEPMNFSNKNRITLPELHGILRSILFPASVSPSQRFHLTNEDYRFVRKYMSQLPSETSYPSYDSGYYDAWCKFLLLGGDRNAHLPPDVRIFNKVGDAYGFLLDVAYIADFENKVECMVSAVIYCNADEILNDDVYDYNTTGLPFMKHLGEVIYRHELTRKRKHLPNLEEFRLQYDR